MIIATITVTSLGGVEPYSSSAEVSLVFEEGQVEAAVSELLDAVPDATKERILRTLAADIITADCAAAVEDALKEQS